MKKLFAYALLMTSMCIFTACPSDDEYNDGPLTISSSELKTPLTIEAITAGTITIYKPKNVNINYTINSDTVKLTTFPINAYKDDIIRFYGDNLSCKDLHFEFTMDCYVYGNVMSLIRSVYYPTTTELVQKETFYRLFYKNYHLKNHPTKKLVLPATTLSENCYYQMFEGCTKLESAPLLPATSLKNGCYYKMFANCSNLTEAPELPATTLATDCYSYMFDKCSKLSKAPKLPATTLAARCYFNMFAECSKLSKAPKLPAKTMATECYVQMFELCKGLVDAPELPATKLAPDCYCGMFYYCSNLTEAPELPATELAEDCYASMFVCCKNLTKAPDLIATTLVSGCYDCMFKGCKNLSYIRCLAVKEEDNYWSATLDWVKEVASQGTFVKSKDANFWNNGYDDGIPKGWTVIDE